MLKEEIKKVILKQSDQRKAEIACELNRWKWPKELKKFLPEGEKYGDGMAVIDFISGIIGEKAFLREWNKNDMDDLQFERWFRRNFTG